MLYIYCIVPSKCLPLDFDSSVVFKLLRVTARHAKFCNTVQNLCTASDERCEALATRLQVGPFSIVGYSLLYCSAVLIWLKRSTDKATTLVNSVAPVSELRIRGGRLHRDIQAPPPCKRPLLIFGASACPGQYIVYMHTNFYACI